MKISLVTSLHLHHGSMSLDARPGDPLPLQSFVPVGLLSLKATADRANIGANIRVVEINGLINAGSITNDDDFYDHIVDTILESEDALVGLMTDADSLHHTVLIAERIKWRSPKTLVCLGGPAASPMSRLLLETFPFIDLVVRGEGELTFVELLETLRDGRKPVDVLGLTWRDSDEVIENCERRLIDDLDTLPIPSYDAFDMIAGAPLYLDVGRGCPFMCHFCATAPFWSRKYRMKSIDRIVEEMTLIRDKYGRDHVNFSHDIFTCDRAWTLRFCERLINDKLGMTWTCSTRTDIINPDILAQMARAGCDEIYYGIESGSREVQKQIHKNLDLEWSREIVRTTAAVGIRPITGFIVGYPMETYQTLQDTLTKFFDFLQVSGVRAHLFTLCPFHESPMYRDYNQTISRPAEYFELSLTCVADTLGEVLKKEHPSIFSSTYRYATHQIPEELIDASEEISAQLVVLKSIWPHLLPYYSSPLDWYMRWVSWIRSDNAQRRPGSRMTHQGNAYDILRFVSEELKRLELVERDFAELVRYEQMKLDARRLVSPPALSSRDGLDLGVNTVVTKRCDYLVAPFRYDLGALLSGKRSNTNTSTDRRWVIFSKDADDTVTTIQIGDRAKEVLERSDALWRVGDLIARDFPNSPPEEDVKFQAGLQLIQQLIKFGLLIEVN